VLENNLERLEKCHVIDAGHQNIHFMTVGKYKLEYRAYFKCDTLQQVKNIHKQDLAYFVAINSDILSIIAESDF
jgi:hypothetical protein